MIHSLLFLCRTVLKKTTNCVILGLVLMCGLGNPALADELFLPSDMLLSKENRGIFVRSDDSIPVTVLLSSNSDILRLPDSVFIPAGKNHALFDVSLHGTGDVQVIANIRDTFWNVTTSISDGDSSDYRILLVFPKSSMASKIDGLVYLVDDLLNPVRLKEETVISLVGVDMDVPESINIPAGESHASLSVEIYGDSTLAAYTDSSISETVSINYNKPPYRVHLGVAPDVIAPHSFGYVAAWITGDSGGIARLPMPIPSQLHVSGDDVLSVDGAFASLKKIHLRDGLFYQKIFSHNKGNSTVTVSVPGYGTASKRVTVNDYEGVLNFTKNSVEHLELSRPNYIRTEILPPITDSESLLILSMYRQIGSEIYPVYGVESAKFSLVSQGLTHDTLIDFMPDGTRSQSILVPVSGDIIGNHTISVSSVGVPSSRAAVEITGHATYGLTLTPLPPSDSEFRALFTISAVDSFGAVIDPHYTFADLNVRLLSDEVQFKSDVLRLSKPVTVIYGKSEINHPRITVIAQNEDIISTHQGMLQNNLAIDIQTPDSVHAGEAFPVYAYLVADGVPLSMINHYLQSGCEGDEHLFTCMIPSQFVIFENGIGFATKPVDVFENTFKKGSIRVDFGDDELYVGSPHHIRTRAPPDVSFNVVSEVPFNVTADSIMLRPETFGTYNVSVIFSKIGYATHRESNTYTVNDEVLIDITAVDENGVMLSSTVNVFYHEASIQADIPASLAVPRGSVHLEFLPSIIIGTENYIMESVMINNGMTYRNDILDVIISEPTDIQITYKSIITVNVNGGTGTGLYKYGDTITLKGASRDVVWFLVRDVFDHWTYMPAGYDIYAQMIDMPAENSFETSIVYRADYSGLVLVMVSAVLGIFALVKRTVIYRILGEYAKER